MGVYTSIRFKGIVKEPFRKNFEPIAMRGEWEESKDPVFREFGGTDRATFIPCGSMSYYPSDWKKKDFKRNYNKETGEWTFQCSLKNYSGTIERFMEMIPYFTEDILYLECFCEEWVKNKYYKLIDGEVVEVSSPDWETENLSTFAFYSEETDESIPIFEIEADTKEDAIVAFFEEFGYSVKETQGG